MNSVETRKRANRMRHDHWLSIESDYNVAKKETCSLKDFVNHLNNFDKNIELHRRSEEAGIIRVTTGPCARIRLIYRSTFLDPLAARTLSSV